MVKRFNRIEKTKTRIVGRVKNLESTSDASSRTSGKATVVYLDDHDKPSEVTLNLSNDDYQVAMEAHQTGAYVEVIVDLNNAHSKRNTDVCESFVIIE